MHSRTRRPEMPAPVAERDLVAEHDLLRRARTLAGHTVNELARAQGLQTPPDLRRHKGWLGNLIECCLDARAGSRPIPDFPALGIELKTLPLNRAGHPGESTFVCSAPLTELADLDWEHSPVRAKLSHVLWVPVEASPEIPLGRRRVGSAVLWQPDADQSAQLRSDWEEIAGHIGAWGPADLTGHVGELLQLRPKAADSKARRHAVDGYGSPICAPPRGFYLRARFTREILAAEFPERSNLGTDRSPRS